MKYQLLPPLSEEDRAALEASIVEHGVLVPVEYDEDGNILDGHHRVEICEGLGLVDWPRFVRKGMSEEEKRTFAREVNFARRHLTAAQKREQIAGQLRDTPSISSRAIAKMLAVDHKTVSRIRKDLIDGGEIPHHEEVEGRDGVRQPARKTIRTTFLPEPGNVRELMSTAKAIRDHKREHSRKVRTDLINTIAERGTVAAGTMPRAAYPVLYADPPWQQEAWSDETGQDRGLMYPPMPLADIKALFSSPPISGKLLAEAPYANDRSPATRDAVLFLWVTTPRLDDGVDVMRAWGFDYSSSMAWDKLDIGMGRRVRDRHETLLIGTRGSFPAPPPSTLEPSLYQEKKGPHSRKPAHFAEMIERQYPDMRKLELFQRKASLAEGDIRLNGMWDFWGFEASGAPQPEELGGAGDATDGPPPCSGHATPSARPQHSEAS